MNVHVGDLIDPFEFSTFLAFVDFLDLSLARSFVVHHDMICFLGTLLTSQGDCGSSSVRGRHSHPIPVV